MVCFFCSPTSSSILSLTLSSVVINRRTRGSHQAVLWENSTKTRRSQALVFRAPCSFWPSFPFIGSFSCHRSPRQRRVFCPPSLSPHLSLRTGHLAGALSTPRPHGLSLCARASVVVCLPSAEVSFLTELRRKDCFSCVYTGTSRSHRTARSMTRGLSQAGALSNDRILQLILVQFHLSSSF